MRLTAVQEHATGENGLRFYISLYIFMKYLQDLYQRERKMMKRFAMTSVNNILNMDNQIQHEEKMKFDEKMLPNFTNTRRKVDFMYKNNDIQRKL